MGFGSEGEEPETSTLCKKWEECWNARWPRSNESKKAGFESTKKSIVNGWGFSWEVGGRPFMARTVLKRLRLPGRKAGGEMGTEYGGGAPPII